MKSIGLMLITLFSIASHAGTIQERGSGARIYLTQNGQEIQLVLESGDGIEVLGSANEGDRAGLEKLLNSPFAGEACTRRSKKKCLVSSLHVRLGKAKPAEKLELDEAITPFGLTAYAGQKRLNEAMLATIPLDLALFVPNFILHGTVASMNAARKNRITKAMSSLEGGQKVVKLRPAVFKKLVQVFRAERDKDASPTSP